MVVSRGRQGPRHRFVLRAPASLRLSPDRRAAVVIPDACRCQWRRGGIDAGWNFSSKRRYCWWGSTGPCTNGMRVPPCLTTDIPRN